MDMDYNSQIVAAKFAVSYLERAIWDIGKHADNLPTDDYKTQVIATQRLYETYLKKLQEWLDSEEK